jgi:predicted RecA/RadA family phage recombinase
MKNQVYMGPPTGARFVTCPSTVKSGDAVLVGAEPAVALNDYQSNSGGATFYFGGTFSLTVVGSSSHSPYTGEALGPGAQVYASGTLDTATNVTTALLISGTTSDTAFGFIDPTGPGVTSGATNTATPVRLQPSN